MFVNEYLANTQVDISMSIFLSKKILCCVIQISFYSRHLKETFESAVIPWMDRFHEINVTECCGIYSVDLLLSQK